MSTLTLVCIYTRTVGRIRNSLVYEPCGLDLFVSGDQLLRGAALNAVLIAEKMVEQEIDYCAGPPVPVGMFRQFS